jgi:hypothetical protein
MDVTRETTELSHTVHTFSCSLTIRILDSQVLGETFISLYMVA